MKKSVRFLNAATGAFIGVFIGSGIYRIYDYAMHPGLYALQAAPWYSYILINALFTLAVVALLLIIRRFVRKRY